MSLETQDFYEFGDFRLDLAERALLRGENVIPVTPKVFETLCVLIESAGRTIEKDELMRRIWEDRFVEESNLTFNIGMLRKALGDDAAKPRYVETVPRRGYRFIAEVRRAGADDGTMGRRDGGKNLESSTDFPSHHPIVASSHRPSHSGAVVAIADWRHEAANKESAEAVSPEIGNGRTAGLKTAPARQTSENKFGYRSFVTFGAILLAVSVGLGYAAYRFFGGGKSPVFSKSEITRLTANGKTKSAAVSPDGKFVAYVLQDEGRESLWLKTAAADGSDVRILPPAEAVTLNSVSFAPGGNAVYYAAQNTLYQIPILGGLPKKVLENFGLGPITFSPDGKEFAFIKHNGATESAIVIVGSDGTNGRILAASKAPEKFLHSAAWSPDGAVITAAIRDADGGNKIVAARVADGSVSVIPSPIWGLIWEAVWQPDGGGLFVIATEGRSSISAQIWRLAYPGGEATNVSNDFSNYRSLSLTADGRRMVLVREQQTAHVWTLSDGEDASRARQLTHGLDGFDGIWGINFLASPDRIIYGTEARVGAGEAWAIDAAGDERNAKRLADKAGAVAVSPNGNYLIIQSSEDGNNVGLFRLDLRDGGRKRLTTGADLWATVSPDGKWVVYTRWAGQVALWKISIDGGEPVKITDFPGASLAPSVSPDGKLIAFYRLKEKKRGETPEIALLPFDGGEIVKSFAVPYGRMPQNYGKDALQWTADGQAVNFISHRDGVSNVWRQPVNGGAPAPVTNFTSGQIFNFAYAPDGKKLALSRGTYNRDVILLNSFE